MKNSEKSLREELEKLKNIETKYKILLDTIPSMAWFTDIDGNYVDVNKEFMIHSGKTIEDIYGKNHKYVRENKTGNECVQNDHEVLKNKDSMVFEEIVPGQRGYRRFDIYRSPVIDENGNVIGISSVANDVTGIKNRDTQFQTLIENIPFMVWLVDIEGNYISANSMFAKEIKTTVQQLMGRNLSEFYDEDTTKEIFNEDRLVISSKKATTFKKNANLSNQERIVEVHKTPVFDIANEVVGVVGVLADITDIENNKNEIRRLAYTDAQTGLYNRRGLFELVNNREKGSYGVTMLIDIDNFKYINDTYGHYKGDEIIEKVAKKLQEICPKDLLFRFGGDEFIIISPYHMEIEEIKEKAQDILNNIYGIEINLEKNEKINVSIGITRCSGISQCNKKEVRCDLISMADIALYKAKEYGKNRYVIYTEDLEEERNLKLNMERALKNAVENDEVNLFYQPQYTKEGKLIGFEALFRWKNKNYSHIPTIDIIKLMEKKHLVIHIGKEIIRKACLFAKKINENKENKIIVSMNVSTIQIMDDNFIEDIKMIIKETQVCTSCIGMEITETVVLDDIDNNSQKIKTLKELGIKISLDDFGTGYSSLNYLVKLPISVVKIDRSFVVDMENSEEYINLIKLIIDISHLQKLEILAEGVEDEKQLSALKAMGVDYIQGYYYSKPLEEQDALKKIEEESKYDS